MYSQLALAVNCPDLRFSLSGLVGDVFQLVHHLPYLLLSLLRLNDVFTKVESWAKSAKVTVSVCLAFPDVAFFHLMLDE